MSIVSRNMSSIGRRSRRYDAIRHDTRTARPCDTSSCCITRASGEAPPPASARVVSAAREPYLTRTSTRAAINTENTETNRQLMEAYTLTVAEGQPREHPGTGSAASLQGNQEPLATPAFVYTRKPTSGFLLLDGEPVDIGIKKPTLAAYFIGGGGAETTISF